jgi:DNA-binding transcriptional ArsR family regulator
MGRGLWRPRRAGEEFRAISEGPGAPPQGAQTSILKQMLDYRGHLEVILKQMLQQSLDQVFHALSDGTRRAMIERLAAGPASVTELSTPFSMSLSAIGQHVQLLEASGLVTTQKKGRVRMVELKTETLIGAELWFEVHRARWERRLDRLGCLLEEEAANPETPKPGKRP